jgi:hypothetical protein
MSAPKYSIIPKPQKYDVSEGAFTVTSETEVLCYPEFIKAGKYLSNFLKTKKDTGNGSIKFIKDEKKRDERRLQHERDLKDATKRDGLTTIVDKSHMKTDVDTVQSKIAYRIDRYSNHIAEKRYRFGIETDRQRRSQHSQQPWQVRKK